MPKLNILPKKRFAVVLLKTLTKPLFYFLYSWHVGTKENVLRVKRDEAEARAREEEKAKRALLAVGFC